MLLGLEHPVVTWEFNLLFFKGDSTVATQEPMLPPNLYSSVDEGSRGGGVLGSSCVVPSSILTVALTSGPEVVVCLNKYFIVFVSLFSQTD